MPIAPPESFVPPGELAPRALRLAAALADGFLAVVSWGPGLVFLLLLAPLLPRASFLPGVVVFLAGSLGFAVYQMVLVTRDGQTLGKRWFGIRIVRKDGSPAGFGAGVFRRVLVPALLANLVSILPDPVPRIVGAIALPLFGWIVGPGLLGVADVLLIFGPSRRCLHDYLAGTRVIRVAPPDRLRTRQLVLGAIFVGAPLMASIAYGIAGTFFDRPPCPPGLTHCPGESSTGCGVDLAGDLDHCGACGHRCPRPPAGEAICEEGTCALRCGNTFADCNHDASDGCETDLWRSPDHCGACGHGCLGGRCKEGTCEAVRLGPSGVTGFALGRGALFATTDTGAVVRVLGTQPDEVIAMGQVEPRAVAANEDGVYWCSGRGSEAHILRWQHSSGVSVLVPHASARAILPTAAGVLWIDGDRFYRVARPGDRPTTVGPGHVVADAFAADESGVYWFDRARRQLLRMTPAGLEVTVIVDELEGAPAAFALDGRHLYWSALLYILRAPKAGGRSEVVARVPMSSGRVAVDDHYAYTTSDHRVVGVGKDGGAGNERPARKPVAVAADADAVYWLDESGSLERAAK